MAGAPARVIERFVWADPTPEAQAHNLAGQCIRHYDTAGLEHTRSVALTGVPLSVARQLLKDADNPDTVVDWQDQGDAGLEPDAHITQTTPDATGAVLSTEDAAGHRQRLSYDVAGQLAGSWLTLKGGTEQVIVKALSYSAAGQKLREEHGNGVVTTYSYEPDIAERIISTCLERFNFRRAAFILPIAFLASQERWRDNKFAGRWKPSHTCIYRERHTMPPGHLMETMESPFEGGMAYYCALVFTRPHKWRTETVWLSPGHHPDPPKRGQPRKD